MGNNMKLKKDKIYHGAAYYPELWDENYIDSDIAYMKELGINVARMAEFSWALLEPEKDVFNIGLFDKAIEKLGKAGISTIMCTPTATPPRWLTQEYPDSLYVDRWMMKSHHGSREHVCFNSPEYVERTKIIVEKLAEHYGNNPYVIAWQTHNEYNCPPVNECHCDNCQNEYRKWLKEKYGTIDNLNKEWGSGVWSTRYNSFDAIIAPRPTPNGHSASMSTCYSLFTFDSVARYNKMQVEILKKYVNVPITHNTARVFHLDHETIFEPLDFVSFDDYTIQAEYQNTILAAEMCRCLKPGQPFWEMETATGASANLHGRASFHKRGYVEAEAVAQFFAGSIGFSYWLFRQQRSGTEMPHAHLITSFNKMSTTCENVKDVKKAIEKLQDFLISTTPSQAKVGILYSDRARMYVDHETIGGNNYANDFLASYSNLLKTSVFRDVIYESNDFSGYDVIIIPYVYHLSDALIEKIKVAAENGATVVVGPYSGWRTYSHAYYTDNAFGKVESLFGQPIVDWEHLFGQDAVYSAYGETQPIEKYACVLDSGIGEIKGGYYESKSLICENQIGKGKVVFVGTKFNNELEYAFFKDVIGDKVQNKVVADEGIIVYEREDNSTKYLCMINMTETEKQFTLASTMNEYFTNEKLEKGTLKPCEYIILK